MKPCCGTAPRPATTSRLHWIRQSSTGFWRSAITRLNTYSARQVPKRFSTTCTERRDLLAQGLRLPRSTRTIWQILTEHGRIGHRPLRIHVPMERPDPLVSWQLDLKDADSVPPDPDGKHQHVVETFDIVDVGTSIALRVEPGEDYTAETVFTPVVETLREYGLPDVAGFDRDPRFVGAESLARFPQPVCALLALPGRRAVRLSAQATR